jgi:hypothetical protein
MARVYVADSKAADPDDQDVEGPFATIYYTHPHFWFLWPEFHRLAADTGEMIDDQQSAFFSGALLEALQRMLITWRVDALTRPAEWPQHVGADGDGAPIYRTASRTALLEFDDVLKAVKQARESGRGVLFYGE